MEINYIFMYDFYINNTCYSFNVLPIGRQYVD